MFTVILLSQAAKTIYPRAKAFFDPFVDDGRIAFCEWNESDRACTLAQAIPELPEVIRGKGAWRAIVVDHSARSADAHRHPQNPFDFTDNTAFALNLQDSPHALVRVSHALLGYPAMSARSFEPVITYRGDDGGRVHEAVSMGEGWRARLTELSRVASDVRVDYRAVPYSDDEHAVHAALTERYRVRETKPAEVVFVSTRAHVDLDDRTLLAQAWRTESEQNVSRFVERNDYPPTTRFAVYDLLNPENSGYEQDELRFWLSILTVAVNELPPSAFQGDRLYQLGIEFSDADLADQLNEHMSRLTALREHLDAYLDRTPRAPETQVRDILAEETVLVEFDKLGGEELVVDTAGYGFARDAPRDEAERWAADFSVCTTLRSTSCAGPAGFSPVPCTSLVPSPGTGRRIHVCSAGSSATNWSRSWPGGWERSPRLRRPRSSIGIGSAVCWRSRTGPCALTLPDACVGGRSWRPRRECLRSGWRRSSPMSCRGCGPGERPLPQAWASWPGWCCSWPRSAR